MRSTSLCFAKENRHLRELFNHVPNIEREDAQPRSQSPGNNVEKTLGTKLE